MAGQTGVRFKLPPAMAAVNGIRDCVVKIALVGDDHDKGKLLAGGIDALCGILRHSILSSDE